MPVQRIPRYKLLIGDILKNTSKDHSEYNQISTALKQIESIATFVNEGKRKNENSQILIDLAKKLKDKYSTLVQPNRQFVREHNSLQVRYKDINEKFNVYVFKDMMILLSIKSKSTLTTKKKVIFVLFLVTTLKPSTSENEITLEVSYNFKKILNKKGIY